MPDEDDIKDSSDDTSAHIMQKQHPTAADSLRMDISQIAVTWQVQSRSPTL